MKLEDRENDITHSSVLVIINHKALTPLYLPVILVFPANDSCVLMCSQVLALVSWSGFALQELDAQRHRVPALPLSVTVRTALPFTANGYWATSPNAEHSHIGM